MECLLTGNHRSRVVVAPEPGEPEVAVCWGCGGILINGKPVTQPEEELAEAS